MITQGRKIVMPPKLVIMVDLLALLRKSVNYLENIMVDLSYRFETNIYIYIYIYINEKIF